MIRDNFDLDIIANIFCMDRKERYPILVLPQVHNFSITLAANPTRKSCSAGFPYQIIWPDTAIMVFSWTYARAEASSIHSNGWRNIYFLSQMVGKWQKTGIIQISHNGSYWYTVKHVGHRFDEIVPLNWPWVISHTHNLGSDIKNWW